MAPEILRMSNRRFGLSLLYMMIGVHAEVLTAQYDRLFEVALNA